MLEDIVLLSPAHPGCSTVTSRYPRPVLPPTPQHVPQGNTDASLHFVSYARIVPCLSGNIRSISFAIDLRSTYPRLFSRTRHVGHLPKIF
jgi:hypothetical protein